ncbi:hypothetical protein CQ018_12390 [Arthrobacter sp. MYb227]|uniref:permease prefix domain 1-containing protein n=1 Tax=Arthrobacter sp. MYb227 TaxID=1848601 RepID=UPI000CFC062A|nr:permease prefix domain 1-containing protein [Arthrobacter sp. MYb227]PQZ92296.1 hypothetical protein CQ018_12390 [Arthrobacter sp. MYb227]
MKTLTNRYITAVIHAVPESQRNDVQAELAAAIADLTDARLEAGASPQEAEHSALLELGDPMRLAAEYSNRKLQLIGPDHYPTYIRLLKVLAATVLPIAGTGIIIANLLTGADAGDTAAKTIVTLIQLTVQLFFWVTVVFAILERNQAPKSMYPAWDPSTLPDPPQGGVKLGDTIASIIMSLVGVAYLVWQHFRSPFTDAGGAPVPSLEPSLWSLWIPVMIAGLLTGAVVEFLRYRAGGWSWPFVGLNAVTGLLVVVPLVWLAATNSLLNPPMVERLVALGWHDAALHINVSVIVIAVGILVWELIDSTRKVRTDAAARTKHSNSNPS